MMNNLQCKIILYRYINYGPNVRLRPDVAAPILQGEDRVA